MFNRVKGTQDILDLTLYNFALEQIKKHVHTYNFHEIATPIIEQTELFRRSLGLQTDVVSKEMFIMANRDEQETESICLRPEATASIMRAFIENGIQQTPWKVFLHGPMFRYERPQKGRYRQFTQVSIEVIGASSVANDVQLITMFDRLFHHVFNINSYVLLLNFLGCQPDRAEYKKVLKKFLDSSAAQGICDLCKERKEKNILRIFDCKNPQCQEVYKTAPRLLNHLCQTCATEWDQLQESLDLLSVSYQITPNLVRGLDYYNKTVFEFSSANLGAQSAFCGGGRYDQLALELGAREDQPSVGAAIGFDRLLLLLEPLKEKMLLPTLPALYLIIPLSRAQQSLALLVADELLAQGLCTELLLDDEQSVKSMMRKANKSGAAFAIMIGENEQQNHSVTIKNMLDGTQEEIKQSSLVDYLKKRSVHNNHPLEKQGQNNK